MPTTRASPGPGKAAGSARYDDAGKGIHGKGDPL